MTERWESDDDRKKSAKKDCSRSVESKHGLVVIIRGKHRNDADKNMTNRKQRGCGGTVGRTANWKENEESSISTRRRRKTCKCEEKE